MSIFKTKTNVNKRNHLRAAALSVLAVFLIGAHSCIDKNYRVGELDKSAQLAPGGLSIPLGYLDRKTLGDLINKDIIVAGEDGGYVLRHEGKIDYKIDAVNVNSFSFRSLTDLLRPVEVAPEGDGNQLPGSVSIGSELVEVPLDGSTIPSFDMSGANTKIEGLNLRKEGVFPVSGTVSAGQSVSGTVGSGPDATIDIDVNLPEQVEGVTTVWLKDEGGAPSAEKATVTVRFDPGGIAQVAQSIVIDEFTVTLPGRYSITPAAGYDATMTTRNSFLVQNYALETVGPFDFIFYITEVDMSDLTPNASNDIIKTEYFSYNIDYTLTTKTGTVGTAAPSAEIKGSPAFLDAAFTTNEIDFKTEAFVHPFSHTIEGISEVVESVGYVAFGSGNTFTVTMEDLGLPASFQSELPIKVTFPASFDMEKVTAEGTYDNNTKTLTAKASDFITGYTMKLKGIALTGDAAKPSGGKLDVGGDITVEIDHTFAAGKPLRWSVDVDGKSVPNPVEVGISAMELTLDYAASEFTLNSISQDVATGGQISESFDIPSEVKDLSKVFVENAGNTGVSVEMILSVEIRDRFPGISEFYLDDFTIRLPSFLMIDEDRLSLGEGESFDAETNTYVKDLITIAGNTAELARFPISGLGGITIAAAVATIEGDFEFTAKARTPQGSAIDPSADNMVISPKLEISDISVTGLEGMFDIDLERYLDGRIDPIDFSEVFDILGGDTQRPDLADPVLTLTINNPLGLNFLGSIVLDPKNGEGDRLECGVIELNDLKIDPATGASGTETRVFITDNGSTTAPAGYVGYDSPLSQLVDIIPHRVDIDLTGNVNPDSQLINTLMVSDSEYYDFSMDYAIEVPLAFGPDMNMVMEFEVDDLADTFSDLAEQQVKAADITVYAGLTISFPLKLKDVEVRFTDAQGDPIPDLTTTVTGSIEGPASGGTPQQSLLTVRLGVPDGGDFTTLSEIDIIKIRVPISSVGAENSLNAGDWIEGNVWLELGKGISVDIGEL